MDIARCARCEKWDDFSQMSTVAIYIPGYYKRSWNYCTECAKKLERWLNANSKDVIPDGGKGTDLSE